MNGRLSRILVVGTHSQEGIRRFRALPDCSLTIAEDPRTVPQELLRETEIFVGFPNPALVRQMPRLRFVQLYSAGADDYSWLPKEVVLANAYGAFGESIAEHMLTVTLMAMKRLPEYLRMQERQDWSLLCDIDRFAGSRVLSVGMGAIGTAYLQRAAALGAECYGVRRTLHERPDFVRELVTPEGMDALLPEMDVVAVSLPGTRDVSGMFDERRLRLFKKSAILLNVGRGNCVVTEDLLRVMAEGRLKAACLDVMEPEPLPKGHPLWTAPRVYITPHIAGGYRAGVNYDKVIDAVIRNLGLVLQGQPPVHIVDRELGY